ncbi:MAG: efflux RND transporter periplasmic adaptor subunit [Isosphaeraceae bacterium]
MSDSTVATDPAAPSAGPTKARPRFGRKAAGLAVAAACGLLAVAFWSQGYFSSPRQPAESSGHVVPENGPAIAPHSAEDGGVRVGLDLQRAIGLKTVRVDTGDAFDVHAAPGRVVPNETQYAFITPRAPGVVRSVAAHIGQDVKAGDLLATIDSPEIGQARLDLYTRLQALDVARTQFDWQDQIYSSTTDLLERIQKGESPETIHNALTKRAVGENRERLITAYAQYRLAAATMSRNKDLYAQELITEKQFLQVTAEYEVARSAYQGLMDQTGFENRLAYTRAGQALKQAESMVRSTRERLRILGVNPDGTEPRIESGKVVSSMSESGAEAILPGGEPKADGPAEIPARSGDTTVSTYAIWAPFDGTILDREMIVPGVAVDTTHRIFTLANLSTVWVEANVHESDFDMLSRSRDGMIRFQTRAYPGRVFEGRVVYSGDLVDEQSRTVKLLASADNPGRMIKPGMFVEVEVLSPRATPSVRVPASALLTQGGRTFVFVKAGPEHFVPKTVKVDEPKDGMAVVRDGLEPGEEVVAEGGSKLKAIAAQAAGAGS